MADRIDYAVSATPVELVTLAVTYTGEEESGVLTDTSNASHEVVSTEIGKSFGGSGSSVVTDYSGISTVQGYKDRTVSYREAIDSDDTTDISTEATASFVFIKNTGYTYISVTALGASLSKSLKVMVGTTMISILDAGEAIVLKDDNAGIACTGIHVRTVDTDGSENAIAGHLAVEYLVVD